MKLNGNDVIHIFAHNNMTIAIARQQLGLKLKPIGSGVFRRAFRVNGFPLVAKFCRENVPYAVDHSKHECTVVRNILTNAELFKQFSRHIPDIYTSDPNGTILMKEYKTLKVPSSHKQYKELAGKIRKYFNDDYDLDENQFGVDERDNLIVLDWGFVGDDASYKWWNTEGYKCEK